MRPRLEDQVIWHDVECGGYSADLALWRELAASANGGAILDVGAGSGRVALDLGLNGYEVVAVELEPKLAAALAVRADGLNISVENIDARKMALGRRFPLCLIPMQTIQLFEPVDRKEVLRVLSDHLEVGGRLAIALAGPLEGFDPGLVAGLLPVPDLREVDRIVYASQPVAVRVGPQSSAIERVRRRVSVDGSVQESVDVVELHHLSADELESEGLSVGLTPCQRREIPETDEHIASTVVVLQLSPA